MRDGERVVTSTTEKVIWHWLVDSSLTVSDVDMSGNHFDLITIFLIVNSHKAIALLSSQISSTMIFIRPLFLLENFI